MANQKKKWLFIYILYGSIVFFLSIYVLFPNSVVKDYITARVAAKYPVIHLSIEKLSFIPILGFSLNKLSIRSQKKPGAALDIKKLTTRLSLFQLFKNKTLFKIKAEACQGIATGVLRYDHFLSTHGPETAEVDFEDIRIDKCPFLHDLFGRPVSGKLKGTLAFKGNIAQWTTGTGKIRFALQNGTYPLLEPFAGMDKMSFKKIEGSLELRNGILKITRLELTGQGLLCSLNGNVLLVGADIGQSRLDLTGSITLPGAGNSGNRKLPLAVTGIFANAKATVL